ncbi:MAG: hypothetical protein IT555_12560 [Acetobacteraceae bacterium]|nr:hypothetical protein [Acetobacteraceae bacterium]
MDDTRAISAATPTLLRVSLMGPLAATAADGTSLLPRGRKARALLAILALASPEPMRRERLAGLLWSNRADEQARASLRQCVHELSTALGPAAALLAADRRHVALRGAGLALLADPGAHPQRLAEDLAGADPAFDRYLDERRRALLVSAVARAEAVLAGHLLDPAAAPQRRLDAAAALLALDPAHEGAWRAIIQVHADRGARGEALASYDRCVAALADTHGMVPSAETRALAAALRGGTDTSVTSSGAAAAPARPAGRRRSGVRLGVMPLRALSAGIGAAGNLGGLSLGLADEITTALARLRWLFLIASPSMAALAGATPGADDGAGWRALDLDFLLDGTIQHASAATGARIRVNLRLLDLRNGHDGTATGQPSGQVVWSGRFERDADDLLTLQDEIAAEAVAQIDPELMQHESRRAGLRPASSATAYDLVLRAIPALYQLEEAEFLAAGAALTRAVALDPGYAAAHAWLAYWHIFLVGQGWTAAADPPLARDAAMARAGELAKRAMRLDPADARALTIAGHARAFLRRDPRGAMALHERALALNPSLPLAWTFSGLALCYLGQHAAAVARIEQARRLSPFDPNSCYFDTSLMVPHLLMGRYEHVVALGRRAVALHPTLSSTFKVLLAALGHLGEIEEAAQMRERLYRLEPGYSLAQAAARSTFLRPEDDALFLEGLRRAGVPA